MSSNSDSNTSFPTPTPTTTSPPIINATVSGYVVEYPDKLYIVYLYETVINLYVIVPLLLLACLVNILVLSVFLRKSMRSSASTVMVAIALSDTFTAIIWLTMYIGIFGQTPIKQETITSYINQTDVDTTKGTVQGFVISGTLCFAIKSYLNFAYESGITCSTWLTVFLAIQRYFMIRKPYRHAQTSTNNRRMVIACVLIVFLSPVIHIYVFFREMSTDRLCRWHPSTSTFCYECVYQWIRLTLCYTLPVLLLVIFTFLFIRVMRQHAAYIRKNSDASGAVGIPSNNRRGTDASVNSTSTPDSKKPVTETPATSIQSNQRRVTKIVVLIVAALLMAELPRTFVSLYTTATQFKVKAAFFPLSVAFAAGHALLAVSFNINFWVFMAFHPRFRAVLVDTVISPIGRVLRAARRGLGRCAQRGKLTVE